jgi:hypothetical protein
MHVGSATVYIFSPIDELSPFLAFSLYDFLANLPVTHFQTLLIDGRN